MPSPPKSDNIEIFDRNILRIRKTRALRKFSECNFLHEHAASLITERLEDIQRDFPSAIICGMPVSKQHVADWTTTSNIENPILMSAVKSKDSAVIADEELFPFAGQTLDLIIANLNLHQTNDLPGALIQMQRALKPDGLLIASLFGGETLWQLRASLNHAEQILTNGLSPRVHPFADKQQMGALMQRTNYALPVIDSEIITVTYPNIFKLMKDLRGMAETNIVSNRNPKIPSKEFFQIAGKYYADHFSDSGGQLEATFEIIFLLGWSPHESQQKPLKPGSAKTKLADFLGTEEIGAGGESYLVTHSVIARRHRQRSNPVPRALGSRLPRYARNDTIIFS